MIKIYLNKQVPDRGRVLKTIEKLNSGSIDLTGYRTLSMKPHGTKFQLVTDNSDQYIGISRVKSALFISGVDDVNKLVAEVCVALQIPVSYIAKAQVDILDKEAATRVVITKNYSQE